MNIKNNKDFNIGREILILLWFITRSAVIIFFIVMIVMTIKLIIVRMILKQ